MGWIILIIALLLVLFVISIYNNLVKLRQRVRNAWSQIDVQLQRRFDLIPNLVNAVKGYMKHEEGTLTKIAELRTSWANSTTVAEKAELDNQLSGALKTIMAVSESYPDLKANTNFINLQEELKSTEDKLAFARQFYNDIVTMYNMKLEVIPSNIVASLFNFKAEELFKTDSNEARQNVKVDFNN
ncbi:MAG: LemA family protein [Clostridia bacterium]|nr:LemA family protein [Clostridia bacterium]